MISPDPLAVHAHAEHRAHIVTVGRLAERGSELYCADMLALYELRLLHVVRQEKAMPRSKSSCPPRNTILLKRSLASCASAYCSA